MTTTWSRNRWLWVLGCVLAIIVGATTIWVIHNARSTSSHNDCSVVEQLGREWVAMKQSVTTLESSSGDNKDLIAIANSEAAMADKIRAAQASVSAPALKEQLDVWAQATALVAKGQRDAANEPPNQPWRPPPPGADADLDRATKMNYNAMTALRKACPNMQVA